MSCTRYLLGGLCLAAVLLAGTPARAETITAARAKLYQHYAGQLAELATRCDEQGLDAQARQVRAWLPQREPGKLYLFLLPAAEPAAPPSADSALSEWQIRFRTLRDGQADALLALARQAVETHQPSLCYELVAEALRENPDHKLARRLLGYTRFRDRWHTPFEIHQLSAGKVWHEKFGWLPEAHVKRYEQGERYYRGRWISAAEDSQRHAAIKQGWRIESEHYRVTTNHSLEEGVQLAERLERLHGLWQQVFPRFTASEAELLRRFDGRVPRGRSSTRHNVVHYRTRDEYNEALLKAQPQIAMTLGIYFDNTRTAYFFAGDEQVPGTLFHEATHQLFQETRPVAKQVGRAGNFWIVEAIACYMESLAEHDGYYTLGGIDAGRVPAARQRLLDDNFYVPLSELVRLGVDDLQRDSRIAKLYSQASGLADFFMHFDDGRYREALVGYLEAVYTGRADDQTLAELTGADYAELDQQYRDYLRGEQARISAGP